LGLGEVSLDTLVLDKATWTFLFGIERLVSRTLSSVVLDKLQSESRQSAVKQQAGKEDFVCKGLVSQLSGAISMEAVATVGAATNMRTAAITAIKIVLVEFIRILLLIII